jgi:hypothetical protein
MSHATTILERKASVLKDSIRLLTATDYVRARPLTGHSVRCLGHRGL